MEKTPLELQLFIIEHLDALDIFHLELTCRHFRNLISTSAAIVWRRCLRQHCVQNGLFLPSFRAVKQATELKEACVAGHRLYRNYQRATAGLYATGEAGNNIFCEITPLSFLSPPDRGDDIYLVPGGRFLVTFHTGKWICVWDLSQSNDLRGADFNPTLLLRHTIERLQSAIYIEVMDTRIVMLVLLASVDDGYSESMVVHELLQLSFVGEDKCYLQSLGRLSIILPDAADSDVQFMSWAFPNVVFHLTDHTTLVWDVLHRQVSGWKILDVGAVLELFFIQGFLFYIDGHGLHGVAIPPFRPIEDDTVSSSAFSNDPESPLTPLVTLFHLHLHRDSIVEQVSPPDLCSPRLTGRNERRGCLYEIKEIEPLPHPTKTVTRRAIYRYRFDFQPNNPTQSTLRLIEIATPRAPPYVHDRPTSELNQHSYQGLNGRLGSVWSEDVQDLGPTKALFFSFSSYFDPSSPSFSLKGGPQVIYNTELNLLKLTKRHWPTNEQRRAFICEFCPNSGKVVVLWDLEGGRTAATMYTLKCR